MNRDRAGRALLTRRVECRRHHDLSNTMHRAEIEPPYEPAPDAFSALPVTLITPEQLEFSGRALLVPLHLVRVTMTRWKLVR